MDGLEVVLGSKREKDGREENRGDFAVLNRSRVSNTLSFPAFFRYFVDIVVLQP